MASTTSIETVYRETTAEEVLLLIREWFDRYGEPPREVDWNPNLALRLGRVVLADRFIEDGCWPPSSVVRRHFGTWSAGIIQAGFYPRNRPKAWLDMPVEDRSSYLRRAIVALKSMDGGE